MAQGVLGGWVYIWRETLRLITTTTESSWGFVCNFYNCQGRSKDFYKPVVLKVTCRFLGITKTLSEGQPGQNHFHNNTQNITCFFHCIGICLDDSIVRVGKTASILLAVAPNYTRSHYILHHHTLTKL